MQRKMRALINYQKFSSECHTHTYPTKINFRDAGKYLQLTKVTVKVSGFI